MKCLFVGRDGSVCHRETQYKWNLCESHYSKVSDFQRKVVTWMSRPGVEVVFTSQYSSLPKVLLRLSSGVLQLNVLLECWAGEKLVGEEQVLQLYGLLKSHPELHAAVGVAEGGYTEEALQAGQSLPDLSLYTLSEVMSSLINFDSHWQRQKEELEAELRKVPFFSPSSHSLEGKVVKIAEFLEQWVLEHREEPLIVVTGEDGSGKTFLLKHLAYRIHRAKEQGRQAPVPIYLSLEELSKTEEEWEPFFCRVVAQRVGTPIESYSVLRKVMENGQVLFLIDHFGETYQPLSPENFRKKLEQVLRLAFPKNKVVLALPKTYLFSQDIELAPMTLLRERAISVLAIDPWNRLLKSRFLETIFGGNIPDSVQSSVFSPGELQELSQKPLWLYLASRISTKLINQLSPKSSPAQILELYLTPWCESEEKSYEWLEELAWQMAEQNTLSLSRDYFPEVVRQGEKAFEAWSQKVPFLVWKGAKVQFSHRLFLDYFAARKMAKLMGEGLQGLSQLAISAGTAWWLAKILSKEKLEELRSHFDELREVGKRNGVLLLYHYDGSLESLNLEEVNLEYLQLPKANFRKAQLARANFRGANLVGASFAMANLEGACFQGALLSQVSLSGAKLSQTDFTDCRLEDTNLEGVDLRQAILGQPEEERRNYFRRLGALV